MSQHLSRFAGVYCFREEDYDRARNMLEDGRRLPADYAEWQALTKQSMESAKAMGYTLVMAYIDLNTFPAWCRSRGLNLDSRACADFANAYAAARYQQ